MSSKISKTTTKAKKNPKKPPPNTTESANFSSCGCHPFLCPLGARVGQTETMKKALCLTQARELLQSSLII